MRPSPIALPICRDVIFPYDRAGWHKGIQNVLPFIIRAIGHGQNYLEGKQHDKSRTFYCHASKTNDQKYDTPSLINYMAEAFVDIIAKSKNGSYNIDRHTPVFAAVGRKNIEITAVNFKQRKIFWHHNKRHGAYAIPQNYRSKDATIDGLGIKVWSVWKAIGANFFQHNKQMLIDMLNQNANKEFVVDIDFYEIPAITIVKREKDEYISPYEDAEGIQNISIVTSSIDNIYVPYKLIRERYAWLDHSYMNEELFLTKEYYFNPITGKGFTTMAGKGGRPPQILPLHIKGNTRSMKLILGEKAWIRILKYNILSTITQFILDVERPSSAQNSQTYVEKYSLPEGTAKLIMKRMAEYI